MVAAVHPSPHCGGTLVQSQACHTLVQALGLQRADGRRQPHHWQLRRCVKVWRTNMRTSIMNLSSRRRSMPNHSRRMVRKKTRKYAYATYGKKRAAD